MNKKKYANETPEEKAERQRRHRRAWDARNPEKRNARRKRDAIKRREAETARHKRWAMQNAEKLREYNKRYREENRDTLLVKQRIRSQRTRKTRKDGITRYPTIEHAESVIAVLRKQPEHEAAVFKARKMSKENAYCIRIKTENGWKPAPVSPSPAPPHDSGGCHRNPRS